jgi:hypothetical protein
MDGERIIELVLGAEERSKKCAAGMNELTRKYRCMPVVTEIRRGGTTVQMGIDWIPEEQMPGTKPNLIL